MSAVPSTLELGSRRQIYQHIRLHPGKYLRELQRDLAIAMGALEYHLGMLERAGLVTVIHSGNKRFFPNEMDRRDKRALGFLRQELPRRILLLLIERGPLSKATLTAELRTAPSTLGYHLKRLLESDLVRDLREETATPVVEDRLRLGAAFEVKDPDRIVRLLIAYQSSLLDQMVDNLLLGLDALRRNPADT